MVFTYLLLLVSSGAPALAAFWARRTGRPDALIALYVLFVVLSQILAAKIAVFDFGLFSVTAPAAVLIFSVTFLLTDIVNERFGRAETLRMIGIAFVGQIVLICFSYFVLRLAPAPFWPNQEAWRNVFGLVPRITIASLIVFLVSENLDAFIFHWFKRLTSGRFLWMRNAFSTIPALTVDTVLFVTLAFYGTGLPLWPLMVGQFFTKWLVGLIDVPFMYLNRSILGTKHAEEAAH